MLRSHRSALRLGGRVMCIKVRIPAAGAAGLTSINKVLGLVCAQAVVLAGVAAWDSAREGSRWVRDAARTPVETRSSFRPPSPGSEVAPVRVAVVHGPLIDITASDALQCLVQVDRCQPCIEDLLRAYDQLFVRYGRVSVIARSPVEELSEVQNALGWRLPMYPEPAGSRHEVLDAAPRPWVMVIRGRRVAYAQQPGQSWHEALARVETLLITSTASLRPAHQVGRER